MKLLLAAGFLLLAFTPSAFSEPDSIYAFSPDVKITESGEYDGNSIEFYSTGQHYTAYRGDTVYVIWQESRENPFGTWILFAKSKAGVRPLDRTCMRMPGGILRCGWTAPESST